MNPVLRVFVLGGTGSIGTPIVRELVARGHEVMALVRSEASARIVSDLGALPIPGDITQPEGWLSVLPPVDGLIHVAATCGEHEELVDGHLLDALLPYLNAVPRTVRVLYTGGCWLFGAADGGVTDERTPFDPLPHLAWSTAHVRRVLEAPGMEAIVIHPGMVYEPTGGVFRTLYRDAVAGEAVRIAGGEHIRWPLVHGEDLATLYCLALERGIRGESYLGVSIDGLAIGRLARAFAERFTTRQHEPEILSETQAIIEFGPWAAGYARDQVQTGNKARRSLGWAPVHTDPLGEISRLRIE